MVAPTDGEVREKGNGELIQKGGGVGFAVVMRSPIVARAAHQHRAYLLSTMLQISLMIFVPNVKPRFLLPPRPGRCYITATLGFQIAPLARMTDCTVAVIIIIDNPPFSEGCTDSLILPSH